MKTKKTMVYHVTVTSTSEICFEDILNIVTDVDGQITINLDKTTRYTLQVRKRSKLYAITFQRLSSNELPFVANIEDGSNEEPLDIGDDKALSYKNIFVFNADNNKLFEVKMDNFPRAGRLRLCLQKLYEEKVSDKVKIRFGAVINKNLTSLIKNANTITTATIASYNYCGESIKERGLEAYDKYLGGKDYDKITKLKGRKGANIKHIVSSMLDDIVSGCELGEIFNISMCIDDQTIDLNHYYKQIPIEVVEDSRNKRYVDYKDLEQKLVVIARDYSDEE